MWRAEAKRLLSSQRWRLLATSATDLPLLTTPPLSLEPAVLFTSPAEEVNVWHGSRSFRSHALSSEAESHSQGSPSTSGCPSCKRVERTPDGLFCQHCGSLQSVNGSRDFFSLMGMKQASFKISDSLLDKHYKDLQRRLHPDRFSNRPQAEQQLSEDASALVNEAFSTLKQPLRRAEYMLQQRGVESGEETIEDPELLVGIMEAREAVEAAESAEELQTFGTTFQRQADNCIQGLLVAFQRDDIEGAKQLTTLLRYVTRVQTAILEKTN